VDPASITIPGDGPIVRGGQRVKIRGGGKEGEGEEGGGGRGTKEVAHPLWEPEPGGVTFSEGRGEEKNVAQTTVGKKLQKVSDELRRQKGSV